MPKNAVCDNGPGLLERYEVVCQLLAISLNNAVRYEDLLRELVELHDSGPASVGWDERWADAWDRARKIAHTTTTENGEPDEVEAAVIGAVWGELVGLRDNGQAAADEVRMREARHAQP